MIGNDTAWGWLSIALLVTSGCIGDGGSPQAPAPNATGVDSVVEDGNLSGLNHTTGSWDLAWSAVALEPSTVDNEHRFGPNCIFVESTEDFEIVEGHVVFNWTPPDVSTNEFHTIAHVAGGEQFREYWVEHRVLGYMAENYTIEVDGWAPEYPAVPPDMVVGFVRPDRFAYVGLDQAGTISLNLHHTGAITEVSKGSCG